MGLARAPGAGEQPIRGVHSHQEATRDPDLCKRGKGYGVESFAVDGNDVLEVYERANEARCRCRQGKGPILMEAKTYRHTGHHVNDPGQYMPADRLEYYKSKDPVLLGRRYLMEQGGATESEVEEVEAAVEAELEAAIAFARESPEPSVAAFLQEAETW